MERQARARGVVIVGFDTVRWEAALLLAAGGEKGAGGQPWLLLLWDIELVIFGLLGWEFAWQQ
jgi:hypothetical protein